MSEICAFKRVDELKIISADELLNMAFEEAFKVNCFEVFLFVYCLANLFNA